MLVQIQKALVTELYEGKKSVFVTLQVNKGQDTFKIAVPNNHPELKKLEWGETVDLETTFTSRVYNNNLSLQAVDLKVKASS